MEFAPVTNLPFDGNCHLKKNLDCLRGKGEFVGNLSSFDLRCLQLQGSQDAELIAGAHCVAHGHSSQGAIACHRSWE